MQKSERESGLADKAETVQVVKKIRLVDLQAEIDICKSKNRTPLILDTKGRALAFFLHTNAIVVNGKQAVVEEATHQKTREEIVDDFRKNLMFAMKYGNPYVINLGNAAPDFLRKYTAKDFPLEIFDARRVGTDDVAMKVVKKEELESHGIFLVRDGFSVVVISQFEEADYAEFLESSIPLRHMDVLSIQID